MKLKVALPCNVCKIKDVCIFQEMEDVITEMMLCCVDDPKDYLDFTITNECKKFIYEGEGDEIK